MVRGILMYAIAAALAWGAPAGPLEDPAYPLLVQAYDALRAGRYETAILGFRSALRVAPGRVSIRKDLAYTLLKVGENVAAREQFAAARKLDPSDDHLALEYAFLCFETGEQAEARRVFDQVRNRATGEIRATAERAFQNIDRPLAEGILRWQAVVSADPANFSAHRELARLAARREDWRLATDHYKAAWRLRPGERSLLIDLGRALQRLGQPEQARAALLAASRGGRPRAAERARDLLPGRYPYVYEFENALALDPENTRLRRELAFLLLEMDRPADAEPQFARVVEQSPGDIDAVAQLGLLRLDRGDYQGAMPLLSRALDADDAELTARIERALGFKREPPPAAPPPAAVEPPVQDIKQLAKRSLEAGYMNDAFKYLKRAHREDPTDFEVMLDLGKAHNIAKQDDQAVLWFDLARRSPDPKIAAEAARAYRNLRSGVSRFRLSFWAMPFYSSRWNDVFAYAQFKTEVRLGKIPIRPYISVRFAGDARRTIGSIAPQYLSESSFVLGVGLRTIRWKGLLAWAEAGSDVSYLDRDDRGSRMAPDYRGGVSFAKAFGNLLGGEAPGAFFETYQDGVFMSRFENTFIAYSQNRFGYTPRPVESFGGFQTQFYWNANLTADTKRQGWANFTEFGPGFRFRWKSLPRSMIFSIDFMRGVYLLPHNPRGPNYRDIRAGVWYAFSR